MIAPFERLRRARLRALLHRHLSNAAEVWRAYHGETTVPPLRFRNGLVLHHGAPDAAVFLFFEIVANGCYRRRLAAPTDGAIVDLGANIGAFTLDCAARYRSATIHAYEPDPIAYRRLEQNVRANGLEQRVRTYAEAVGRASGTLQLWGESGSIAVTGYPNASDLTTAAMTCPMVDLATVIGRIDRRVDVVKIDVEGAEADIVEGGGAVLRRATQFVGEYHDGRVPGALERCRRAFEAAGFAFTSTRSARCGPLFHARRID